MVGVRAGWVVRERTSWHCGEGVLVCVYVRGEMSRDSGRSCLRGSGCVMLVTTKTARSDVVDHCGEDASDLLRDRVLNAVVIR